MTLTTNKKEILRRLIELLTFVAVISAIYFLIAGFDSKYLFGLIIALVIGALPSFYLFIEYLYYTSKLEDVTIVNDRILIHYADGDIKQWDLEDLKELRLYKSKGMDKGGAPLH